MRARGSSMTSPWPGAILESRIFFSRSSVAMYCAMSPPVFGETTEYMPSRIVSPVNRIRSSSRKKQRWFGACPGVCRTSSRNSVPSIVSPSRDRAVHLQFGVALVEGEHLRARRLHQRGGGRRVIGVRVREQHPADAFLHRRPDDRAHVLRDVRAGIDHRDLVDADQVRVRARPRHVARVRRHDPAHERRQRARHLGNHVGHQAAPRASSGSPGSRTRVPPASCTITGCVAGGTSVARGDCVEEVLRAR